jgi:hypothetical protein
MTQASDTQLCRRQCVLESSIVIVIGPTPPGTGVIYDAIGSTAAKSTSPHSFPSAAAVHAHVYYNDRTWRHHVGGDEFRAPDG